MEQDYRYTGVQYRCTEILRSRTQRYRGTGIRVYIQTHRDIGVQYGCTNRPRSRTLGFRGTVVRCWSKVWVNFKKIIIFFVFRIIEINGQSVVAVPHERIVNLLATSVGEVSTSRFSAFLKNCIKISWFLDCNEDNADFNVQTTDRAGDPCLYIDQLLTGQVTPSI